MRTKSLQLGEFAIRHLSVPPVRIRNSYSKNTIRLAFCAQQLGGANSIVPISWTIRVMPPIEPNRLRVNRTTEARGDMTRLLFGLLAAGLVFTATGCCSMHNNNCQTCDGYPANGHGVHGGGHLGGKLHGGLHGGAGGVHPRLAALHGGRNGYSPDFGPPSAAIAYPYYTTRGPRDFLEPNPPTIGR
jgi:hypothetical protein